MQNEMSIVISPMTMLTLQVESKAWRDEQFYMLINFESTYKHTDTQASM